MNIVRPDQEIAIDTLAVRIPPVGTGRLRRTTTTMRGISASATGTRTTTTRTTTRLCGVSAEPLPEMNHAAGGVNHLTI
jgi:hypothetical protein